MQPTETLPESNNSEMRKKYHAPQLTEWGTLANKTKGSIAVGQEAEDTASNSTGMDVF